jgi:succinate dehydrogenase / fumarate reductase cytochrome b subunit
MLAGYGGMSGWARFYRSSIGAKMIVALTGAALFLFVVVHMLGNLQVFLGRSVLNAYAQKLQQLPLLLWTARAGLLLFVGVHVVTAVRLHFANRAARPVAYSHGDTVQATITSRTMIWSGLTIAAFVVYHLLHFTFGVIDPAAYRLTEILPDGSARHDVYSMVVLGFRNPLIAGSYILAMLLLAMHLHHGVSSLFQTLGLDPPRYRPIFRKAGPAFAVFVGVGNVSMPLAVLAGWIQLPPGVAS